MNRYTYEYRCEGMSDWWEFSTLVHPQMPSERIAEGAAEDYSSDDANALHQWPRTFRIRGNGIEAEHVVARRFVAI